MDCTPSPRIPLPDELAEQRELRDRKEALEAQLCILQRKIREAKEEARQAQEELRRAQEEVRRLRQILVDHGLGHLI